MFEKNKLKISKRVVDSLVNQEGYIATLEEHFFLAKTKTGDDEIWNNYVESLGLKNLITEIDLINFQSKIQGER